VEQCLVLQMRNTNLPRRRLLINLKTNWHRFHISFRAYLCCS